MCEFTHIADTTSNNTTTIRPSQNTGQVSGKVTTAPEVVISISTSYVVLSYAG